MIVWFGFGINIKEWLFKNESGSLASTKAVFRKNARFLELNIYEIPLFQKNVTSVNFWGFFFSVTGKFMKTINWFNIQIQWRNAIQKTPLVIESQVKIKIMKLLLTDWCNTIQHMQWWYTWYNLYHISFENYFAVTLKCNEFSTLKSRKRNIVLETDLNSAYIYRYDFKPNTLSLLLFHVRIERF